MITEQFYLPLEVWMVYQGKHEYQEVEAGEKFIEFIMPHVPRLNSQKWEKRIKLKEAKTQFGIS